MNDDRDDPTVPKPIEVIRQMLSEYEPPRVLVLALDSGCNYVDSAPKVGGGTLGMTTIE